MKELFKIIFGSCLGTIIALAAIFLIGGGVIGSVVSKQLQNAENTSVKANSVLLLKLEGQIPERTNNVQQASIYDFDEDVYGVHDICRAIRSAKDDAKIKGIFLSEQNSGLGFVKSEEIRKALLDFKESGKFIYCYSDMLTNTAYYFASVADEIILHPMGMIDLRGFGSVVTYYTDFLKNIGVDMEIYYAGKYKSFTEPYRRNDMSPENREQLHGILDQIYTTYIGEIATSRNMSVEQMHEAVNDFDGRSAQSALEGGLIDKIGYSDEMIDILKENLDLDEDDEINYVEVDNYTSTVSSSKDYSVKNKIAVVYAEGSIAGDSETNGQITGDPFVSALRDIRENDEIKAVVLRVDSGGGSALISDRIWREFSLIREAGKPVVVSMGNYAASGGYYIASSSDKIFADDKTITGSIGVFALIPNLSRLAEDKLKIHFDTVRTADYATAFSIVEKRSEGEKRVFQEGVENTYNMFLQRVADNRGMTVEAVNEIAQGRVWTGLQAKELGLVDELGTLEDAIAEAASLADLETYRLTDFPKLRAPLEVLMERFGGSSISSDIEKSILEKFPLAEQLIDINQFKEPQAKLPFTFQFD